MVYFMEEVNYTPVYANENDIRSRITFLQQPPKNELIHSSMKSGDSIVSGMLGENNIPVYHRGDDIPSMLQTAACYYAISDILRSLYGKDDRSSNEKGYREDADSLMYSFIQQMKVQDEKVMDDLDPYGISQSPDAFELGLLHR